ncbi:CHAT domain-containing protein [Paraburkholderia sp. JPY432]|uniref:CHAT domain-containing tetratricopeptide repeat protein n=1 Tax=Paraburkholderia youngii TaxID=2782701 RepID=UPI001595B0F1|nr:CHAT domain-containing protein [Paraburkholderia youngii]NVH74208.1 CHAT domain-containing protein [Paraburkholderia youngii]
MRRISIFSLAVAGAVVTHVPVARADDDVHCLAEHVAPATIPEAEHLYKTGKLQEAAAAYSEIAENTRSSSSLTLTALEGLGRALKAQACDQEAMEVQSKRLALAERVGDEHARRQSQARLARLLFSRDSGKAAHLANLVIDESVHGSKSPDDDKADAYTTLALIALGQNQLAKADEWLASARTNATSSVRQAEIWRTLGILRQVDAKYAKIGSALDAFQASLASATDAMDIEVAALAQICIAGALPADKKSEAVEMFEAVRVEAHADHMRRVEAYANFEEGKRGSTEAQYSTRVQAQQMLVQAVRLDREIGDESQERGALLALANASYALGDDAAAADAAERSGVLSRDLNYVVESAKTVHLLALIAFRQPTADRQAVLRRLQSARDEMSALAGPSDQARVLHDMAIVALSSRNFVSAQRWLVEGLALLTGSQEADADRVRQQIGVALGWTLLEQGATDAAIPMLRTVTAHAEGESRGQAWWGLARAYVGLKQFKVARLYYERALGDINPLRPHGSDVQQTASLSFDQNYSSLYREFAALLMRMKHHAESNYVMSLAQRMELVEAYWPQTGGDGAQSSLPGQYEGRLTGCEQELAERAETYKSLWLERESSAAAAQSPMCCHAEGGGNCNVSDETVRAYCEIDSQVRTLQKMLQRDEKNCIARVGSVSEGTSVRADPALESKWSKAVGSGTTLVVTIVENDRLDVMVRSRATSGYIVRVRTVGREHVDQLVSAWKMALQRELNERRTLDIKKLEEKEANSTRWLQNHILRRLYALLFDGLDDVLLPPRRDGKLPYLAVVLDGPLRDIPLAALYDGRQYLGEKAAIAIVMPGTPESQASGGQIIKPGLAVGMSHSAKPALPEVKEEITKVAETLHVKPYLDEDASTSMVLSWLNALDTQNLALHIAAHGAIGDTPDTMVIHLSDGDITGRELAGMTEKLAYLRLVVFSACDSASVGQSNFSMGLADIAANGAHSVIGSLWPVDDPATTEFMEAFYENWVAQGANGVAQAMAAAQQRVRVKHPHPFYWAAFVTIRRWD